MTDVVDWKAVGKRLCALRVEKNVTQEEVAKIMGVSRPAYVRWETASNRPKNKIPELAQYFGVTTDYLLYGKDAPQIEPQMKGNKIPLLGSVAAGIPIEAIQYIEDYEEIPAALGDPREFFALRVKGESMEPKISDGDIIIVHKQEDVDSGQISVVQVNGDEATVKIVKKSSSGITLIGLNVDVYPPHFYTSEEVANKPVRIVGKVVRSIHEW